MPPPVKYNLNTLHLHQISLFYPNKAKTPSIFHTGTNKRPLLKEAFLKCISTKVTAAFASLKRNTL
jgi:hypothetical protein